MISELAAGTGSVSEHSPAYADNSAIGSQTVVDMSENKLDLTIRCQQCDYMLARQPISIFGTLVASALVVIALLDTTLAISALIWFAVVFLNQIRRVSVYLWYKRGRLQESNLARWEANAFWGSLVSGCLFGVTPIIFWPPDVTVQFALTILAFAVTLASIQITVSRVYTSQAFALAVLLPFVMRNALEGAHNSYLIAALELTALLFFLLVANTLSRAWIESLRYRIRNQMLLGRLEKQATHLQHEATHDALTGLPNRAVFFDRLQHVIARARRQNVKCAVVYFDLDRFKSVNDTYGHHVGDELLRRVAVSVSASTREGDSFCRLAGDEFAILAEEVKSPEGATRIAEEIQVAVRSIDSVTGHPIVVSASIGIAMFPHSIEDEDAGSILARADMAMYVSKKNGRGMHTFYQDCFASDFPTYQASGGVGLQHPI